MGTQVALVASVCTLVVGVVVIPSVQSSPSNFFQDGDTPVYDYIDNDLQRLLFSERKRNEEEAGGGTSSGSGGGACIPRGGNCDSRINDCCDCCSCRCNLWGVNCRCQRRGLFQKIGK
ncbi:uncharacterized protein LOC111056798 [Nilaparvata lugens]|uniref:uncharacterized protein LOC111056798 n=1 Tax=Nilaparvata lugens TaxID=108931 RepID=UPI000B98B6D0|nr:uncharacterized protein LOC111056798 [Nilaparvata lugens]